jgi:Bacterial membrane protein YfhO
LHLKNTAKLTDSTRELLETGGKRSEPGSWLLVVSLLATLFLIVNLPLVTGKSAPIWDAESFFAPAYTLIADHARAGRFVLWNPWQSAGSPDVAEPELGNSSPIAFVLGGITGGTESGFRAYWLLIWFCGPLGLVMLARHLGARPWGALVVASGYAVCGFYTSHAEHTSSIYSFSFLPWLLWRFDLALSTRRLRFALEAGALWGLSALGGYPQLTILSGCFLVSWAAGRRFFKDSSGSLEEGPGSFRQFESSLFGIAALAVVLAVGLLVLAPSYVPFFAEGGTGYSDRVGARSRAESISSNPIQAGALTTFSSPYLTNLKLYGNKKLWPWSDASLTNIYVGSSITVLMILALFNRPKSGWRWWLFGVGLFFLLCAVGNQLPLRGWLYDYFPPTRYFRNPALFRAYTIICASILALLATNDIETAISDFRSNPIWPRFVAASVVVTTGAVVAYVYVLGTVDNIGINVSKGNRLFIRAWFGIICISLLALRIPRIRKWVPLLLILLAITDATLTMRIARETVYSLTHSRQTWTRINAAHVASLDLTPKQLEREPSPPAWIGGAKNNENVPMKIATLFNYATMTNRFQADLVKYPSVAAMALGKDRIWFSDRVVTLPPTDRFFSSFVERSQVLGAPVLIVHSPSDMPNVRHRDLTTPLDAEGQADIARLPAAERISTELISYTPNHLRFKVWAPRSGWLLVTDRWSKGWRATVNDKAVPVYGGNFAFRALRVLQGENRIVFDYHPAGFPALLIISWTMLAAILVLPQLSPNLIRQRMGRLRACVTPAIAEARTYAKRYYALAHAHVLLSWFPAGIIVISAFVLCNFRLVIGSEALPWDASAFFAPAFTLVADHARTGRIMLWNPWISAGSPDYAEPELGAISPIQILLGLFFGGTETGFRVYHLLIWLLGPIGFVILARHLRAPPWGGAIVALGMMFCGFYTGHVQHTSSVYSFSWLPWIVWRLDVALISGRPWPAIQGGAFWGLSALGGYPELVILTAGLLFLLTAGRLICVPCPEQFHGIQDPFRKLKKRSLSYATAFLLLIAVGVIVLAPSYAAFFSEGHGFADRVGTRSRQEATASMTMPVGALTSVASPYVAKLAVFNRKTLWPQTDASMVSVYVGVLIPLFALLALLYRPASSCRWWLAGLLLFSIVCAVGDQLPVRGWLYDYVYPTRYFRNSALFREYGMFCAAVLALLGLGDIARAIPEPSSDLWKKMAATALVTTATAIASYVYIVSRARTVGDLATAATAQVLTVWLGSLSLALLTLFLKSTRQTLPVFLLGLALADAFLTISVIQGGHLQLISSGGKGRDSWNRINAAHNSILDLTPNGLQRVLRTDDFSVNPNNKNIPLKFATFENYETMWNRFELDAWNHPVLLAMSIGGDRVWFSDQVAVVPLNDTFYKTFVRRSEELSAPVLLIHPPNEMVRIRETQLVTHGEGQQVDIISQLPRARKIMARVVRYTPNHLDLDVVCATEGWLLVTDRWAPGWRATINGHPAEIFGGNFIYRALQVHAGASRIEFSYRPFGFPLLFFLSWGTLIVVFAGPCALKQVNNLLRLNARSFRESRGS